MEPSLGTEAVSVDDPLKHRAILEIKAFANALGTLVSDAEAEAVLTSMVEAQASLIVNGSGSAAPVGLLSAMKTALPAIGPGKVPKPAPWPPPPDRDPSPQ